MTFRKKIALLMLLAAIQLPCAVYAAEEDKELALIAAEQEGDDEQLNEINPALTESISTERTQETDKEVRERKRKLQQARKEKEEENKRKLKESTNRDDSRRRDETIVIDPNATTEPAPPPPAQIEQPPAPEPIIEQQPAPEPIIEQPPAPEPIQEQPPAPEPIIETPPPAPEPVIEQPPAPQPPPPPARTFTPQATETVSLPNQQDTYANFAEVARAVKFIPLYMPRKSGYEITALYASNGIAEVRYGRRWEPTVSLTVKTYKRAEGEAPQDISGVTGVKWRVDTTTGTTLYIAKISETMQVAAWAVGHYTFSAQAQNLSYAGFHSLVSDELIELSTHYYLDL